MSYSFSVTGADKASALKLVEAEMAGVVAGQPVHARDQAQVLAQAAAVVGLLKDDPNMDVMVSCNGSLGWDWHSSTDPEPGKEQINNCTVNVWACTAARDTAAKVG